VLDFQPEAGFDAQNKGGGGPRFERIALRPNGRPLQAHWLADRSDSLAGDVFPIEKQGQLAEPLPRDGWMKDFWDEIGERLRPRPFRIRTWLHHRPIMTGPVEGRQRRLTLAPVHSQYPHGLCPKSGIGTARLV
jgi:hypothetical protein